MDFLKNDLALRELAKLVCGAKLGEGASRKVFVCRAKPEVVLKIETNAQSFSNVNEWFIWDSVVNTKMEKWFAPLYEISPSGLVLIQARVKPITRKAQLPEKIPACFVDCKIENWGMFENRAVCCDYGNFDMLKINSMQTPKWSNIDALDD